MRIFSLLILSRFFKKANKYLSFHFSLGQSSQKRSPATMKITRGNRQFWENLASEWRLLLPAKSSARPGSLRLWFRTILGAPACCRAFRENGGVMRYPLLPAKSFARPGLLEALKSDAPWRPCEFRENGALGQGSSLHNKNYRKLVKSGNLLLTFGQEQLNKYKTPLYKNTGEFFTQYGLCHPTGKSLCQSQGHRKWGRSSEMFL